MKIKAGILIVLFLFSASLPIQAATDEGYGEDETSLGQFVDSFETSGNISMNVNVIRNSTLEVMELNFTIGVITGWENFSDYVHIDPNNKVFPDGLNISWVNYERDDSGRTVFDFGAGAIDPFNYSFEFRISDLDAGGGVSRGIMHVLVVAQADTAGFQADHYSLIQLVQVGGDDSLYEWWMTTKDDGASTNTIGGAHLDVGTIYYCNWYMVGTNKTLNVYTDSAMTVQVEHISHIKGDDAYRYLQTIKIVSNANDPLDDVSGYMNELFNGSLTSGGTYESEGYFSTVDYLSDPLANGSALVAMINTSIPANTQILVEFSEDNSTWIFNDWAPLSGGFEAVDLRDLNYSSGYYSRFNLSTTDTAVTPRVYQNRVITTIGNASEGKPGQNVTGEWIEYRASSINASVGIVDGGDLNSTFEIDGDTFNVSEVVGAPGMLLSVNFTGIDPDAECVWITIWYLYNGNLNHVFEIEMWNFISSSWVDDGLLVDTAVFEWSNSTIYALRIPNEFLSGGEVRVQLNHETPGNINHDLFIDYIRLIAEIPSDVAPAEPFQFFWIVIAIALMIVGIVLARMWPEEGDP